MKFGGYNETYRMLRNDLINLLSKQQPWTDDDRRFFKRLCSELGIPKERRDAYLKLRENE